MASKRHARRRSCSNKIAYSSEEEAKRAAWETRRRDKMPERGNLYPYKCEFGPHYHIGHVLHGSIAARKGI
jgi:hypothetical protein